MSAPLQLCASRNEASIRVISSSFVGNIVYSSLLEYLVSLVVGSLVCMDIKFYPFGVSSCLNVR